MKSGGIQKKYVRQFLKYFFEIRAKILKESFDCKVFKGEAIYDLSINCDMTVSCNAQDYDGYGQLGKLDSKNTISKILNNSKSKSYVEKLRSGKLPLNICARCPELVRIKNGAKNRKNNLVSDCLIIENTVKCDLMCKSCEREEVEKCRSKMELSLDNIRIISNEIKNNNIRLVSFFNLGEPFLSKDIFNQLEIIKKENPKLHIVLSTNGLHINTVEKIKSIKHIGHILFSIDGADNKMLRKYQTKGDFNKSYSNMKRMVAYRDKNKFNSLIEWKYVLFNWNDSEKSILKAISLARAAGVDVISFWPTFNPVYGISWRYYFKKYFKNIGVIDDRGVILVNIKDK